MYIIFAKCRDTDKGHQATQCWSSISYLDKKIYSNSLNYDIIVWLCGEDKRSTSFFFIFKNYTSKTTKEFHFAFCRSVCVVAAEEEVSASMASAAAEAFAFVTLVINTLMKRSKWMETRPLETLLLLRPHQLLEEGGYHNFGLSVGDDPWGASFLLRSHLKCF